MNRGGGHIGLPLSAQCVCPVSVRMSSGFSRADGDRPSKHKTLTHCWANVGPPSTTLAQYWANVVDAEPTLAQYWATMSCLVPR